MRPPSIDRDLFHEFLYRRIESDGLVGIDRNWYAEMWDVSVSCVQRHINGMIHEGRIAKGKHYWKTPSRYLVQDPKKWDPKDSTTWALHLKQEPGEPVWQ